MSAHERSKANVTSGEWATGNKWASDAPRELLKAESVSLIASGSCGALVHSLEDEFQGLVFTYFSANHINKVLRFITHSIFRGSECWC